MEPLILIAILIFSVIVHEVSHGLMANALGDPTARLEGRLTLNPIAHIDPMGSIILPAILALSNSPFLFGWAKPVPYNPYNLQKGGRFGEVLVAAAGPASNILLAILFALPLYLNAVPATLATLLFGAVFLNIFLAVFNLIPIPPLDGSKVLSGILPTRMAMRFAGYKNALERNPMLGFGIVILFIILFGNVLASFVYMLASLLVGV